MANLTKLASGQLREIILNALGRLVAEGKAPAEPLPDFRVEIPADKSHGDFAVNTAMVCAKAFKMAPRQIAELICSEISLEGTYFRHVEIAGPGFINFFLGRRWFSEIADTVIREGDSYGKTQTGCGKKMLVEFVSANPTGPMHIGNARGGAIGDCLAEILNWAGYDVQREFYVNDAGNQIEKFGKSLNLRYTQLCSSKGQAVINECEKDTAKICESIYNNSEAFPMPDDVYLGMDIIEHAYNYLLENGSDLMNENEDNRKKALTDFALPKNIAGLERDLSKYRITYDNWFKESTLHNNGAVEEIIEKLKASGYTYEQEGALWFKSSELGDEKDRVLIRANGVVTYFVPDIAYHYNKLVTRGYDKAIDIFGADHHGYIPRMKAALKALGVEPSKLDIVIMQMVNLVRNGEKYKLSKRSGKAVTLSTLLDEIPIDAARFFFNLREPDSHFDFDLDLAVEKSSQNPVYYVQYAHARICSLISNLKAEGCVADSYTVEELDILDKPQEIELIRQLAALPNEIDNAAKAYDPAKITKYSVELATLFHKFYDACSVKNAETPELKKSRLVLCKAVLQALRNSLTIMKISCPEKM
ncbi:MAG: arginine--tRNA ligase [Ruminococcus sp.]|nr:arginine--tRNA ligase [Ruminococcus sp.]